MEPSGEPAAADGRLTMAAPRAWTDHDKAVTAWTQAQLLPLAKRYIASVFS